MKDFALKTWVEINRKAVERNFKILKSLLNTRTKMLAVVKSNAYGHGLLAFSKIADLLGVDGFCVDSVFEGLKLRENGIKKMILVLGPTLPALFRMASENDIAITISNFENLASYLKVKHQPKFHLKIDTGMHRQGFYNEDLPRVIKLIKKNRNLSGIYTHFASAKDINYPTFTDLQFGIFLKAVKFLEKAGYKSLIRHCAATGAALINSKYHLDAVRIGIGLYGLWPSRELEIQLYNLKFQPILSWKAMISEVKNLKKGDYVGYDLTERVLRPSAIAVIPIGYWHGFGRGLSGIGEVLVRGKRAKVLGRVSMDIIVVDVTGIKCKVGDTATIIGRENNEMISAYELAQKLGTTHYEIVTRINPLIERIAV